MELEDLMKDYFSFGYTRFNKDKVHVYKDRYLDKTISFQNDLMIDQEEMFQLANALINYGEDLSYITIGSRTLKVSTGSFKVKRNKLNEFIVSAVNADKSDTAVLIYSKKKGPTWAFKKGYVTTEKRNPIKTY